MLLSARATVQSRTRVVWFCLFVVSRSARRTRADRSEFRTRDSWIDYPWGYPLCYCVAAEVLVRDLGCPKYLVAEAHIHVHVVCTNALCAYCAYANAWSFRMEPARSIVRF